MASAKSHSDVFIKLTLKMFLEIYRIIYVWDASYKANLLSWIKITKSQTLTHSHIQMQTQTQAQTQTHTHTHTHTPTVTNVFIEQPWLHQVCLLVEIL